MAEFKFEGYVSPGKVTDLARMALSVKSTASSSDSWLIQSMFTGKGDPAACLFLFVGQWGSRFGKLRGTACAALSVSGPKWYPKGENHHNTLNVHGYDFSIQWIHNKIVYVIL